MRIDILSLFPDYFQGPLNESILKRAGEKGLLDIRQINIRDFAEDKHNRVDDRPYGGGPGMVMMVGPVLRAIRSVRTEKSKVIFLTPQAEVLTPDRAKKLAVCDHLILLCGHYEGIDERVMAEVDESVSIGQYVLTNGCLASIVLIDVMARFIPGVLGDERSAQEDSFEKGRLDYPHYTRPFEFEGEKVPEVLLSGNHAEIDLWREESIKERI